MALNTSIRGLQIKDAFFGDGIKRNAGDGDIAELALKTNGGISIDTAEVKLDINDLSAGVVDVTADSIAIVDADDSASKKESIDDLVTALAGDGVQNDTSTFAVDVSDFAGKGVKDDGSEDLTLDINGLDAQAVDVANDSIAIEDNDDNETYKESIADLVTAMAGDGLTATDGVLSVDTIADNIIESDIKKENLSSEIEASGYAGEHTLANTPITNSVQVYLNGLLQEEGSGKDYTLDGTTIQFATQPESGDILIVHYILND